jgi:superfamily I DNA and/or RNA helicase
MYTVRLVKDLLLGVTALYKEDIVIITPYSDQSGLLRYLLDLEFLEEVLVFTADSFQGWEKRVVIFEAVVNPDSGLGFLADVRRLCVSITRHTDFLIVLLDSGSTRRDDGESNQTFQTRSGPVTRMCKWFKDHGRTYTTNIGGITHM